MDYYIKCFLEYVPNVEVQDYAVYLEKHSGIGILNIFHSLEQLVIYITKSDVYACRLQNMGSFATPVRVEENMLTFNKDGKIMSYNGTRYEYVRKYKSGNYSDYKSLSEAVKKRENV